MTSDFDMTQQSRLYQEQLELLLKELSGRLLERPSVSFSENTPERSELEKLESWVLSLNSWYFQRFHQDIFPLYKMQLTQEISRLFDIYQDQTLLEQNILFVYKYYAQMYNQLTQITLHIRRFRNHLEQTRLKTGQAALKQSLKFYNQMQELSRNLQLLQQSLERLSTWSQKVEVRLAFKQFPGHFSILTAAQGYQPEDRRSTRFLNELQLQIQLQLDLLQKIRKITPENVPILLEAVQNARSEGVRELPDRKLPLPLRHWYRQYFCTQQQLYLQNLENSLAQRGARLDQTLAERYEGWLNSLLTILQNLRQSPEGETALQEVIQYALTPYQSDQDQRKLKTLQEDIQSFLQTIRPGSDPSAPVLAKGAGPILLQVRSLIQRLLQQALLGNGISLLQPLQETNYILSTAEFTFDEISETAQAYHSLSLQLTTLLQSFKDYQQGVEELREIVNRQLQPRQAERALKSLPFQLERWSFTEQQGVSEECRQRMEEENLAHLLPQDTGSAEGDLFLFRIGSLCECVVPAAGKQEESL